MDGGFSKRLNVFGLWPPRSASMAKTPPELKYTASHEWIRLEGDVATIGITDFAQDQLTDVVYVELPKKGARVESKTSFGVVESVKSVSDLLSPFSGEVLEVNSELSHHPEQINDDPYGRGWMIKVRLARKGETSGLLTADQYAKLTGG